MLSVNTTNSIIKDNIDLWYQNTLLTDYDAYIDDTIYCNNRKIREISGVKQFGGWNPDGGTTDSNYNLQFNEYYATSDLSCPNVTDRFSITNSSAQLTYKVGLTTTSEMYLLNDNTRVSAYTYWVFSPLVYGNNYASSKYITTTGYSSGGNVDISNGVRPSVSLVAGIEYTSGDGSMTNPYVVATNNP